MAQDTQQILWSEIQAEAAKLCSKDPDHRLLRRLETIEPSNLEKLLRKLESLELETSSAMNAFTADTMAQFLVQLRTENGRKTQ